MTMDQAQAKVVDDVPETSSDERMHVLSDNCWCNPMRSGWHDGLPVRKHRPDVQTICRHPYVRASDGHCVHCDTDCSAQLAIAFIALQNSTSAGQGV